MDISIFENYKEDRYEKVVGLGVTYVYKYFRAKEVFEKNRNEENEIIEYAYGKVVDLVEQLTKDYMYINFAEKIKAYKTEIEKMKPYATVKANHVILQVIKDIDVIDNLLQ
ncbi:hypothetical protein [Vallitalea sp.]|jgi:hypothetical protein|uniref:hypothetical protein n=1 Tax=Vallitalea sp. TaxID=1882829 RepID=UPI00260074D2|nr:hypothetical protein [Vallitalea sp.]MCT4686372.1 hypothetical protein [Vallitalea sp.]